LGVLAYYISIHRYSFKPCHRYDTAGLADALESSVVNYDQVDEMDVNLSQFIQSTLLFNPNERPNAEECLKYPWFTESDEKLLAEARQTLAQLEPQFLNSAYFSGWADCYDRPVPTEISNAFERHLRSNNCQMQS
jgi:hypothetical protein